MGLNWCIFSIWEADYDQGGLHRFLVFCRSRLLNQWFHMYGPPVLGEPVSYCKGPSNPPATNSHTDAHQLFK